MIAVLAVYWLWLDHAIRASRRYYLRTALVVVTPVFGALAALGAMSGDRRLAFPFSSLQQAMTALQRRAARPLAVAFMLSTLLHVVETGKFVAARTDYPAAATSLAPGGQSDPAPGAPRLVSAAPNASPFT